MSLATKSNKNCRECCTSRYVLRLQWIDYYPEGSTGYDDHVCLKCGRYTNQGISLCDESLNKYRKKYGYIIGYMEENK